MEEKMEFEDVREEKEEAVPPDEPELDPLRCHSISVGSYKALPLSNLQHLTVNLTKEAILFTVKTLNDPNFLSICLTFQDVTRVLVHFESCLPIMFVFTTANFGKLIRTVLNMKSPDKDYFDPKSTNEMIRKITFRIDSFTSDQIDFLRDFPGNKVKEIVLEEANEMLLKSTPPLSHIPLTIPQDEEEKTIAPVQQQMPIQEFLSPPPVFKLFTYPPPPQTGGIDVTSKDLSCLFKEKLVNDTIIDFYLKYLFNESLTSRQREKIHIFNTFLFTCLNSIPVQSSHGEETIDANNQDRWYRRVKNWTKNVDIFSKDFILIPINKIKHWFLAVISYPGYIPEVTESTSNTKEIIYTDKCQSSEVAINKCIYKDKDDNLNQAENSTSNLKSEYLVPVPRKPFLETSDSAIHPKRPCIFIFDSLKWVETSCLSASVLQKYLQYEWKNKKKTKKIFDSTTMKIIHVKCPQQTNIFDCGLYMLQFATKFLEDPEAICKYPTPDLSKWFSKDAIPIKRLNIIETIGILHEAFLKEKTRQQDSR